ncbi:MAG: dihydrofolate reductase family protein [Candidatus Saccharimonadales bacterium]
MRKLVVCNIMSLDGYYEGPGKNVMDLFAYRFGDYPDDDSFDKYNAERLSAADIMLVGHKSYEGFVSYWPTLADTADANPAERQVSKYMNAVEKVVVSSSLPVKASNPWRDKTRVISPGESHNEIAKLKKQDGKDIVIFASRLLWNDLIAHGLVDELHLMISPVILNDGTPIFTSDPKVSLNLLEARTWDKSGLALVRYKVFSKR